MATRVLELDAMEVPPVQRCLWLRIICGICGEHQVAIPAGASITMCPKCETPVAIVAQADGMTTRTLPWYEDNRWKTQSIIPHKRGHQQERRLSLENAIIARALYELGNLTIRELAREYKVSVTTMWRAVRS